MHKLTIKDGRIYLDDKKIEGVTEYSVKSSEPIKKLAELNLKLIVSTEEDNEKTAQEGQVQEQSINIKLDGQIIASTLSEQIFNPCSSDGKVYNDSESISNPLAGLY